MVTLFQNQHYHAESALEQLAEAVRAQGFDAVVCKERPLFAKDFLYVAIKRRQELLWGHLELRLENGRPVVNKATNRGRKLLDELDLPRNSMSVQNAK